MSTTTAAVQPAPSSWIRTPTGWWRTFGRAPRIMGLDVARALAVLGMVGAHIGESDGFELLDPSTWDALVHGRSSILFAVLAGVSIALMTGRSAGPDPARLPSIRLGLIGRGAAIFIIGIVLELLGTPVAVILTVYGLLYVAAIPFLRWRSSRLFIAAGLLAVAGPPLLALLGALTLGMGGAGVELIVFGTYPITVWMAFVLAGMGLGRLRLDRLRTAVSLLIIGAVVSAIGYGAGALAESGAAAMHDGDSMIDQGGDASWIDEDSWDDSLWDDEGFGLAPEDVDFTGAVCDDYGDGSYYCYPAEDPLLSDDDEIDESDDTGWAAYPAAVAEMAPGESVVLALVSSSPHSGGTAEILGSGGFAVAVIALCLLIARPLRWVLLPLAALGAMPLTAYSAHIIAILVLAGPGSTISGNAEWAWFSAVLLVAATVWAMVFGRGPLERLVGRVAAAMASSGGPTADKSSTPVVG